MSCVSQPGWTQHLRKTPGAILGDPHSLTAACLMLKASSAPEHAPPRPNTAVAYPLLAVAGIAVLDTSPQLYMLINYAPPCRDDKKVEELL